MSSRTCGMGSLCPLRHAGWDPFVQALTSPFPLALSSFHSKLLLHAVCATLPTYLSHWKVQATTHTPMAGRDTNLKGVFKNMTILVGIKQAKEYQNMPPRSPQERSESWIACFPSFLPSCFPFLSFLFASFSRCFPSLVSLHVLNRQIIKAMPQCFPGSGFISNFIYIYIYIYIGEHTCPFRLV
jgi:hypothetical protein